jgi:DNA-binding response OmpR family regulator
MTRTLLIVDDSKLADEGLEKARRRRPAAAAIDFAVPGRDGLSMAAELRGLDPGMPWP